MKKSEFEKQRAAYWETVFGDELFQGPFSELVRRDVAAAEAAGIAWAPEAPALPERLEVDGEYLIAPGKGACMIAVAMENALHTGPTSTFALAVLSEAVRRYNIWPDIRAWAGMELGGDRFHELLAILDGPAE